MLIIKGDDLLLTDIVYKINNLKKQKNAVILAHYYQTPEIQQIADFVGDSLELAKMAKQSSADTIVFCGVYFMAESAKILSPGKRVLIPVPTAGCAMANMVQASDIKKLRATHPAAAVVTYVNSTAEVKAESDICCTSANAVKVAKSLETKEIIFIPDKNLGSYVAAMVPEKQFYYFNGYCPIHDRITVDNINRAKNAYPGVEILVHPECPAEVVKHADFVGSTSQIINYATGSEKKEFIIGTEEGVIFKLQEKNPGKVFHILAGNSICPDMKKTTLADLLFALEMNSYEVVLSDEIIKRAVKSLDRMLEI